MSLPRPRPHRAPLHRSPAAVLSILACLSSLIFGADDATESATSKSRPETATVTLVEDQALVGELIDATIQVDTKYGKLSIPTEDILQIRMRPAISEEEAAELRALVRRVGSADDSSSLTDENLNRIREYGARGYAIIEEEMRRADESRKDDLGIVLTSILLDTSALIGPNDEIVTKRFTVRGKIVETSLQIRCLGRVLDVPRQDIIAVTYQAPELAKTFKVLPNHLEQQSWLTTGVELRKGQKFELSPSGSMTYNGRSFGPQGLSNHSWNSRSVGQLQYRIGASGAWVPLTAKMEVKADQSGELHLSIHHFNNSSTGEFKVVLRTERR